MTTQTATATTVNFDTTTVEGLDFQNTVTEYFKAKALAKEIKALQDRLEASIREAMGEASTANIDGMPRATIAVRNRSNLNKEMIPADIIALATTNTTYTVLTAK